MTKLTFTLLGLALAWLCPAQTVLYVNHLAAGGGDGTSWVQALPDLMQALSLAQPGTEVWVAQGTYRPSATGDREAYFRLGPGAALYGGFAGDEATREQRDPTLHPTVLSGDLGVLDDPSDNSYNVVYMDLPDSGTVLDGFTIRDGNANFQDPPYTPMPSDRRISGAAVHVWSPFAQTSGKIANCTIIDNRATGTAGVQINTRENGNSRMTFEHCQFIGNLGGAIGMGKTHSSGRDSLTISGCLFDGAEEMGGTSLVSLTLGPDSSNLTVRECVFRNALRGITALTVLQPAHLQQPVAYIHFLDCEFSNLQAAVLSRGSTSFKNCTIRDCHSNAPIGDPLNTTVNVQGRLEMDSCLFEGNSGRGVVLASGGYTKRTQFFNNAVLGSLLGFVGEVVGCLFEGNSGYVIASAGMLSRCVLRGNAAHVLVSSSEEVSYLAAMGNTVSGHEVSFRLGGRLLHSSFQRGGAATGLPFVSAGESLVQLEEVTVSDTLFIANTVFHSGHPDTAIVLNNVDLLIHHSLFTGAANCGGVYRNFRLPIFLPTIGPSIYVGLGSATCTGAAFAGGDPYTDAEGGDLTPGACSAALDAGDLALLASADTLDLAGRPRVSGLGLDMGAFERPDEGLPTLETLSVHPPACLGGRDGRVILVVSRSCPPLSFVWAADGEQGASLDSLTAGQYALTITDARGITLTTAFDLPDGPPLQPAADTVLPVQCFTGAGGAIALHTPIGTPPFTYGWSHGAEGAVAAGLTPGTYSATVTDGAGCTGVYAGTVGTAGMLPLAVTTTAVSCHDTQDATARVVPLYASPPTAFTWAHGPSDSLLAGLAPGAYTVSVSNGLGCEGQATAIFAAPDSMSLEVATTPAPDGTITVLSVQGGTPPYAFDWGVPGAGPSGLAGLDAGTYTLSLSDRNGCLQTFHFTVEMSTFVGGVSGASGLALWPNPARAGQVLNVRLPRGTGAAHATWYDALGRPLGAGVWVDGVAEATLNAPEVPGWYMLRVSDGHGRAWVLPLLVLAL